MSQQKKNIFYERSISKKQLLLEIIKRIGYTKSIQPKQEVRIVGHSVRLKNPTPYNSHRFSSTFNWTLMRKLSATLCNVSLSILLKRFSTTRFSCDLSFLFAPSLSATPQKRKSKWFRSGLFGAHG